MPLAATWSGGLGGPYSRFDSPNWLGGRYVRGDTRGARSVSGRPTTDLRPGALFRELDQRVARTRGVSGQGRSVLSDGPVRVPGKAGKGWRALSVGLSEPVAHGDVNERPAGRVRRVPRLEGSLGLVTDRYRVGYPSVVGLPAGYRVPPVKASPVAVPGAGIGVASPFCGHRMRERDFPMQSDSVAPTSAARGVRVRVRGLNIPTRAGGSPHPYSPMSGPEGLPLWGPTLPARLPSQSRRNT